MASAMSRATLGFSVRISALATRLFPPPERPRWIPTGDPCPILFYGRRSRAAGRQALASDPLRVEHTPIGLRPERRLRTLPRPTAALNGNGAGREHERCPAHHGAPPRPGRGAGLPVRRPCARAPH